MPSMVIVRADLRRALRASRSHRLKLEVDHDDLSYLRSLRAFTFTWEVWSAKAETNRPYTRPLLFPDCAMTGPELTQLREDLGDAIGRSLSAADMARLCGLAPGGADTIRRWEVSGPGGTAAELLRILAMASDRYPILENFNVFDRFNVNEKDRPARREAFREKMRDEVRRRLV